MISNFLPVVRQLNKIERTMSSTPHPEVGQIRSTLDVSNPPTAAELTGEFGAVGEFRDIVIINDNGGGANYWLVFSDGADWLYVALSKAV